VYDVLYSIANRAPFVTYGILFVLLVIDQQRTWDKIEDLQRRFDPDYSFVRRGIMGVAFFVNLRHVDRTHPKCTPEFLQNWDGVYGAYWRRTTIGLLMLPVVAFLGQGLGALLKSLANLVK
jgi:hypothetical protein